jgi:hypothetical protein
MATKKPIPAFMSQQDDGLNQDVFDSIIAASRVQTAPAPESSGLIRRIAGDGILTAVKGAIGVPEAAVGLADMASGGHVGKALENGDGAIGFRPKQAKEYLDQFYSPEQKAAFAAVQNAANKDDPFLTRVGDIAGAAIRNPSTIVHAVGESLPSIGAGGLAARGVLAGATAMSPAIAAARAAPFVASQGARSSLSMAQLAAAGAGEGIVSAGSTAEQIRQGTKDGLMTGEQSLIAAGSGIATMGIGMVAAKAAKSLGVGDIDTLLLGGKHVDPALQKGFVRQLLEGAVTEGVMEELPQSVQEQVAQNYALGKPLDEGVDHAAVMGVLTGGAMGVGAQVMHRTQPVPEVGPLSRGANLAGGAVPPSPVVPPAVPPAGTGAQPVTPEAPATGAEGSVSNGTLPETVPPVEELPPESPGQVATLPPTDPATDAEGAISNSTLPVPEVATLPPESTPEAQPFDTAAAMEQYRAETLAAQQAEADRVAYEQYNAKLDEAIEPPPVDELFPLPSTPPVATLPPSPTAPIESPAEPAPQASNPEPTVASKPVDILHPTTGKPFTTKPGAMKAQKLAGDGHEVVKVDGGFVVRAKDTNGIISQTPQLDRPAGEGVSPVSNGERGLKQDTAEPDTSSGQTAPVSPASTGTDSVAPSGNSSTAADENPEWTRLPHADRLALNTRAGMSKLVADKIARTPWADITPKTREKITAAMAAPVRSSETANAPVTDKPDTQKITTDKAEMRPYRKPDGSVGYEAVPIVEDKPAAPAIPKKLTVYRAENSGRGIKTDAIQGGTYYFDNKEAADLWAGDAGNVVEREIETSGASIQDVSEGELIHRGEPVLIRRDPEGSGKILEIVVFDKYKQKTTPAPADTAQAATESVAKPAASANTIFTEDAAEKARAILKAKLRNLNSGLDPEMMQAGITLAGYHIEKGARTFAAYAKAMLADLGDGVKPYLKSWYLGVRFDPRAAKFDGMDSAATVEAAEVDAQKEEPTPEPAPAADAPATTAKAETTPAIVEHVTAKGKTLRGVVRTDLTLDQAKAIDKFTFKKDGGYFIREAHLDELNAAHPASTAVPTAAEATPHPAGTLTNLLLTKIESGNMPKDNPALRKMVESFDGKPATPERMKEAQEAMETAIVRSARIVVSKREGDQSTFDALVRLYASQPNLNIRTSTSIENQAYSTPAPLAFVASRLAGITDKTTAFEPTAGNGMLLIGAKIGNSSTNELNDDRVASLRDQGFNPTQQDATEGFEPYGDSMDAVITNPPFGPIKDAQGNSIKVKVDGYTIGQIDHLIAARALQAMKADGKATLIIGANKVTGEQSNNDLIFFNWLYGNYNVTSHFEVDGDLYQRQGASWPVRVITIDGRNKSSTTAPSPGTIQRATTWSEVYEQFQHGLGAQRPTGQLGASTVSTKSGPKGNDPRPVPAPVGGKTGSTDSSRPDGSTAGNGNVGGASTGTVLNSPTEPSSGVGDGNRSGGNTDAATGASDNKGNAGAGKKSDTSAGFGASALADAENQFQAKYVPRSARKDEGVLIPVNMAGPTQDALNRLEDAVGDIDEFARTELGYDSVEALHDALMGLQVDSVASAIHQIKNGKGIIIADQTGIGKGRQAAAILRWAAKNGKTPVFVTVKPSLFTDMFGDLHDIGTDDIAPFILNKDESIKGKNDEKLFGNKANTHTATMTAIAQSGELPKGTNALFMTYSQINTDNIQRRAVLSLAPNAVFVLDESHNAGGESATGGFIRDAIGLAHGVTYLSATYAKRPDNMPVYFKTDMGDAVADDATLMSAMASGGLPLQTVVSNNLVKAGQMFRRERSFDGVSIESRADTEHRAEHVKMSDATTLALRGIVAADSAFHHNYVKSLQKELEKSGAKVMDMAGNQAQASVDHTQFSSVVHNFVRQMLLGLKAQEAANDAIRSLKRGEKPMIAVENTMGSFLNEYAENNGLSVGDELGAFTYRTVLSRALERSRYIVRQLPNGDKVKEYIPMSQLDPVSYEAYSKAQDIIDGLKIDIPVSPIDWMRQEITNAGFTVAEITGRNLSVDYSDPKNPKLSQIEHAEQKDKVRTTRNFNAGTLDALILNVAGSTGISLHASEKFKDQRQRHMIVAQAAQDINIFMQMLGRIHRTGQVRLPKYTLLSADLPAEIRPTALLSGKMKSLNANTSSNTESATSVKASDMMNKYGDQVVAQYLRDNQELALAMGLDIPSENGDGAEDIARKATGRLALMPVKVQEQFYAEIEEQYTALIDYLNKTNQNELEPKTFDFDAQETRAETIFEGQNKESPFGEDATYGEYSVKAQGKAMTPAEIKEVMAEHLGGKTSAQQIGYLQDKLEMDYAAFIAKTSSEARDSAGIARANARRFMNEHKIGDMFRVEINQENYNAIITNLRNTHKAAGNPYAMSKFQVTIAVNGSLRSVTVPATQFTRIETSSLQGYSASIEREFKVGAINERETAKIITGNLLGAYGEMDGTRGSIITFSKSDGTTEQGILLPKTFNFAKDVRQDYRLKTPTDVFKFVTQSNNENIGRFGINSRDGIVRVMPSGNNAITIQVPKSRAKGGKFFLDKKLLAATGDFTSQGNFMRATVEGKAASIAALDVLMNKQALYALPSMAEEARNILGDTGGAAVFATSSNPVTPGQGVSLQATQQIAQKVLDALGLGSVVQFEVARNPAASGVSVPQGVVPTGGTSNGKVYAFSDNIADEAEAFKVVFHELFHLGLSQSVKQDQYIQTMLKFLEDPLVRQYASEWKKSADGQSRVVAMPVNNWNALAVEEALATMGELLNTDKNGFGTKPVSRQWVRRMIERLASFAQEWGIPKVPQMLRNMTYTEAERFIQDTILKGKSGAPVHLKDMRFASGAIGAALTSGMNSVREVGLPAGYKVADLFQGEGRLSYWHKSVGTMYNLAQRSPPFKRVFDSVQNFLNDVSFYAAEAADLAPSILPKLDKMGDIFKSPLSAADTKALSRPVFEGTLTWGRDSSGTVKPMEDIEAEMRGTSLDDMAHMLLRDRRVSPEVLRMWQGLPQEQYQAIINGKFEREFMKPGVVFTPAELREHFGMTDAQVALYQEFRKATDKSIDNLAISEMLNYAGKDAVAIRDDVLASGSVEEAGQTMRDYLVSLTEIEPERDEALSATAAKMLDIAAHATDMKDRGYAPLSRFGNYTLEATLPTGERYFSLFETDRERNKMARMLTGQGATGVSAGTMSQEAYKLLNGITPETAALFGEMLGLESQGSEAKDLAFQEYIKRGTANRSAMKRLLQRKGIAGFSEDSGRVLAGFIYSNSRRTSSNLHAKETTEAVSAIPKEQGELKDTAVKLHEYVSNPAEEAQAFRGILFAQYLGGSVASAMVNATQPFTVTLPYLTQFGGVKKAAAQMVAALRDATKDTTGNAALDAALKRAEEEGIVSPQEVHSLQAQAMGRAQLQAGDGTAMGNALAKGNNAISKMSLAWGKVFGIAEQFNRRTTFIAAYRTAIEQGIANPAKFAEKAVVETQFVYNKGNKMRWGRGAIGATLFTFKQYSVNYLEMVHRMATAGEPGSPERAAGRKAAVLAIAILFMMAGSEGLPFVEDIEDVLDGAMQRLGYNFSSKQRMKAFLVTQLGKDGAEFVTSGVSGLPGAPIDVSGRLGMGNLIPGTGMFQKKADHTRDLMELAGPAGDMIKRSAQATEQLLGGNVASAAKTIAPVAARNVIKAADMADTGMYRDDKGNKIISTDGVEAVAKAMGFQPRSVKNVQDATVQVQKAKAQYILASGEIRAKMAQAIFLADDDMKQSARDDVIAWNRNNPDQRMTIDMPTVLRKVREMRKSKEQRIADTAPKAVRSQVRQQLREELH